MMEAVRFWGVASYLYVEDEDHERKKDYTKNKNPEHF